MYASLGQQGVGGGAADGFRLPGIDIKRRDRLKRFPANLIYTEG